MANDTPPPLPAPHPAAPRPAAGGKALLALLLLPWVSALAIGILLWAGADLSGWVDTASPGCVFHRLTGFSCPGCGGTRAAVAILRGDIIGGLSYNWFWLPTFAILIFEYIQAWRRYLGKRTLLPRLHFIAVQAYALLTLAWFIGRNIAGI